ncbi:ABC transporter substrate-binding protein [Actinomadura parmotrematis]|uniref:ABC transporter substrate-binding protein n=1 Tax=Actinomadura parmotrematis TaxID=2864039 RepID=A0ABS7G340_9ACTN|nr:ABC transporter substrate-binding protein [Actinomadura parmotrematis]MBW8486760.1 ABC transporter substrate-binding protein [Actinomadura parmotrematis]
MRPTPHRLPGRPAAATALAAAALLASACGSDSSASGSGTPVQGGTLTFAVGSDLGCIDPQQAGSNDTIYSLRQIVDSLTDQDPASGKIVPWLAQSWTISADAREFTFKLRPGVTFSDGSPLNAQAVKDNFDAIPKLGVRAVLGAGYLTGYAGTTVVDDLTAKVRFKQPNAQFLQATSTFSLAIESSASTKKTPEQKCSQGVSGSGPFTISSYTAGQSTALARRSGYNWGSSLWKKKGEAYLAKAVFKVVPEAGVRTGSLQSGQVDAIGAVGLADESALKGAGVRLQSRANPGVVFGISLNNSRPVFKDEKVRQALQTSIDRAQIASTIFPTGTKQATSVLAHTTPYYTDLGSALAYDKAKTAAALDAAGWKAGSDGIRQKDGTRLSFELGWFANAATNQPTLELIQQQLKAVGVEAKLKQYQIAQLTQVQQGGQFDALWGNITRADPDILRTSYSTKLANLYRIPVTDLDGLLDKQAATVDTAERAKLVTQAQQEIVQHAYVLPVVELQTELGVGKKVHDLAFEASSRIQLHDTWIG